MDRKILAKSENFALTTEKQPPFSAEEIKNAELSLAYAERDRRLTNPANAEVLLSVVKCAITEMEARGGFDDCIPTMKFIVNEIEGK